MRQFLKGEVLDIIKAKDFPRDDGTVTYLVKFRMKVGTDLVVLNFWSKDRDDAAKAYKEVKLAKESGMVLSCEATESKTKGELTAQACFAVPVSPTAPGQSLADAKKELDEMAEQKERHGFVKVSMIDGNGKRIPLWRHKDRCLEVNGTWHDRLEYALDKLGGKVVQEELRRIAPSGIEHLNSTAIQLANRPVVEAKIKELSERARVQDERGSSSQFGWSDDGNNGSDCSAYA
jgi:hypothetical protein